VQGGESRQLDVERVEAGRQNREAQLAFLVGDQRERAANQRGRADTHDGARKNGMLRVLDGADEGPRQSLCSGHQGQQQTGGDGQQ
jgi:hypothetical protein